MNNTLHPISRRIRAPLVVLPLLALLLAFLSSLTYQYAAETRLNHGFVGTLDRLVVLSHNESVRALSGNDDDVTAAVDGEGDAPDQWWSGGPTDIRISQRNVYSTPFIGVGDLLPAARYAVPPLRAPPRV